MHLNRTRISRPFLALVAALVLTAPAIGQAQVLEPGWDLDNAASNIRFQSVKKSTVVESSSFATFSGSIEPDGAVDLTVMLESVDTKVDIRNVRMRFLFFETFSFPEAKITAQIDPASLEDLKTKRRQTFQIPFSMDLHGTKKTLLAEVVATLLSDDRVSVASAAPISISVEEFGLSENLAKLEEAAGGITIVPSATVTFDFLFDRRTDAAMPAQTAEAKTGSAALETEGDFSLEACLGRFEVLSKTGNIYFRSGSARLDDASIPLLTSLLDIVERCPGLNLEVAGHTDSDGSAAKNQVLSEARAKSVADYLVNKGVPADRLQAKGYGEDQPVAANDTAANKRRNRRIEFSVLAN